MSADHDALLKRTRAGSRSRRIIEVAIAEVARAGRGLTVADLRAAFERATGSPAPASFTSEVASLHRRGLLDAVGGRSGHTLYAPAGARPPSTEELDDVLAVLAALEALWARLGRPVSTREVAREWRERARSQGTAAPARGPNFVRKSLETLSRPRTRGYAGFREPRVVRRTVEMLSGRPSAFWMPARVADAGAENELIAGWRSQAEEVRYFIRGAHAALGRPAARSEVRWWLEYQAPTGHEPYLVRREAIGTAIDTTVKADRPYAGVRGRVHETRTAFTCHGGAPPRYRLGAASAAELAQCRFEDVAMALRVEDERRSIEALERRGHILQSSAMEDIAWVRRRILRDRLYAAAQTVGVAELRARLRHTGRTLTSWLRTSQRRGGKYAGRQARYVAERTRHVGAALRVLEADIQPLPFERAVLVVGEGAAAPIAAFDELLATAARRKRLSDRQIRTWLDPVRRVPVAQVGGRRIGSGAPEPLSWLDRADALLAIFGRFRASRTRVLLRTARLLLGEVIRDVGLLREWLRGLTADEGVARRAIIVALGLLGEAVPVEEAVPDPADADDASAWVLATVLAEPDAAEVALDEGSEWVVDAAAHVLVTAQARVRIGYPFSAAG